MLIGTDFDKVTFEILGLQLLEPNALIGDTVLGIVSLYLAYRVHNIESPQLFFNYWKWFFILFGVGVLTGGLGHACYNYWGVTGKYFSWFASIVSIYMLEHALVQLDNKPHRASLLRWISKLKLIFCLIAEFYILSTANLESDPHFGLLVPSLTTTFAILVYCGYLGGVFTLRIHKSFGYLTLSVLAMTPAAIVQAMRLSLQPLFDRNDISHVCLLIMLFFYWKTISGYRKHLKQGTAMKLPRIKL